MNMIIAMALITACLLVMAKLGISAFDALKAKYTALGEINALELIKEDKNIDMITDNKKQAVARLAYKAKRDRLISRSKVAVANAIPETN